MSIDTSTTLAELVTANPDRVRTLEAFDLDYCCHGQRDLAAAAAEAGADIDQVVAALAAVDGRRAPEQPDWASLDVATLLEHIVAVHHAYLRDELPRLVRLGDKVRSVHGERHTELGVVVDTLDELVSALEPHLDFEERELFPRITALAAGDGPIDLTDVLDDHEAVGSLLDQLRAATDEFRTPADGCNSFRLFYDGLAGLDADTRLHVHKENNLVFPALRRLPAAAG